MRQIKGLLQNGERRLNLFSLVKYSFPLLLCLRLFVSGSVKLGVFGLLEALLVILGSDALLKMDKRLMVVSDLLFLLLNLQLLLQIFANTYLKMILLTNIDMIQDLSGRAVTYVAAAILLLVISFLPVRPVSRLPWLSSLFDNGKVLSVSRCVSMVLAVELVVTMASGSAASPFFAYTALAQEYRSYRTMRDNAERQDNTPVSFTIPGISDFRQKLSQLPDKPNVILLLTEGMSQHIVDDPRGIMPNLAAYEKKSLNFTNYYNHTFATFRGIISQLYSGYQMENYDSNSLPSLQSIFSAQGYSTCFINTEPRNVSYTRYLAEMGFDELLEGSADGTMEGMAYSCSDRQAYEQLLRSSLEYAKTGKPFFTAMYTFGTHVSLDSPDEKWGDGSDPNLNKFYNLDCQFGAFMEALEQSPLAENTLVVMTSDHATFVDDSYKHSFPDVQRAHVSIDSIPLFFYFKGITPEEVDAMGRNTLDLAPTICDYLDISAVNAFLGQTLFYPGMNSNNSYETYYYDGAEALSTQGGRIEPLQGETKEAFLNNLADYFSVSRSKRE